MKEIDLLKFRREIPEKEARKIKRAKIASLFLLVFYCLAVVGIFSFWIILRAENEQVLENIELQKKKIRSLEQVESLHTFVKQRLSALVPFLAEEGMDYKDVLNHLEALVPEGVVLGQIELNQDGKMNFEGEAANAVVLADFLERLLSAEEDEFIKSVRLSSANRGEDGSYKFTLNLHVKS